MKVSKSILIILILCFTGYLCAQTHDHTLTAEINQPKKEKKPSLWLAGIEPLRSLFSLPFIPRQDKWIKVNQIEIEEIDAITSRAILTYVRKDMECISKRYGINNDAEITAAFKKLNMLGFETITGLRLVLSGSGKGEEENAVTVTYSLGKHLVKTCYSNSSTRFNPAFATTKVLLKLEEEPFEEGGNR